MCKKKRKEKKRKEHFVYIEGRAIVIAAGTNLLDAKYKFCGFNDDLRDTKILPYITAIRLVILGTNTGLLLCVKYSQ